MAKRKKKSLAKHLRKKRKKKDVLQNVQEVRSKS